MAAILHTNDKEALVQVIAWCTQQAITGANVSKIYDVIWRHLATLIKLRWIP